MSTVDIHEFTDAIFLAASETVEFTCTTCKAAIRGNARRGLTGTKAIRDLVKLHSIMAMMPPQLGAGKYVYTSGG